VPGGLERWRPSGSGRRSGAPPPPLLTPGVAQIVGKVVEAGTTSGVAGAIVTLDGPALGSMNSTFSDGIPGGWRAMPADAQGQFAFRDVPAGSYSIRTTASGYVNGTYGESRPVTIRRTLDLERRLEVTVTDKLVPVQIQMSKLGGISGRVLDERGEPLVGAPVSVIARMTDWGGPIMQPARSVTTDDRGVYHADVTPGDYIVGVQMATSTTPVSTIEGFQQATAEGPQALQRYLDQLQAAGAFLGRGVGVRVGNYSVMLRNNSLTGLPPLLMIDGRAWLYPKRLPSIDDVAGDGSHGDGGLRRGEIRPRYSSPTHSGAARLGPDYRSRRTGRRSRNAVGARRSRRHAENSRGHDRHTAGCR
jgi:hypothetical protein